MPGRCDYLILTIEDNGSGVAEDGLSKIFEPFYTTKEVRKGTGLGLSMVFGAVQSHDGLIDLVSYPGRGTRFSIYFPLLAEKSTRFEPIAENRVEEGETVLLVDDDHFLLEVCQSLLSSLGYQVITAINGQEAVETYKQGGIDLVIMDLVMPVLGGKAAAERIQKFDPDAKVIFTTGYDKDNSVTCELVDDWEHVLNKPFKVDELSRMLRQALNKG